MKFFGCWEGTRLKASCPDVINKIKLLKNKYNKALPGIGTMIDKHKR